ncbi:DUF6114 domain-containing protein [Streptomyces carpaticus]|uniref:DUF6114 domain-containing protein n=1 Tax=Streptomyces TaxID=1883 RepID=UPI0002F270FC|nr:DUF6114 domain-containing protein [Streptomyces sp. AA0539]UWM51400.1 DUF6114 domain-containing protein [Streptomyces carpaticus]
MSTTTQEENRTSRLTRARVAFRHWRWRRPFWAGLFTTLAGLPIVYFPYATVTIADLTIRMATTAGAGSLVIGALLIVLGQTMWFQPHSRIFSGVASIMLVLVSLVVSNVGGFGMGYLLGLIGGGMSIAWAPGEPVADSPADPAPDTGADRPASGTTAAAPAPAAPGPVPGVPGPEPVSGTGSALAGFAGGSTERGIDPEKEKDRVE